MVFTASSIFLKALAECGITHAFVTWGSDHPALLEELERQRQTEGQTKLRIITCPNEMVALSAAHGFAQICGRPAAVFVHVDVGTQSLAGAVHNADKGRVPVLIYAGASAFTLEGEVKGSRNEWIMTLQDAPDQSAIVRQYMRFTCQIHSGRNIRQVVRRSLQFAMSEPRGPVYLWARREVMEEEFDENIMNAPSEANTWSPIEPIALSASAAHKIANALLKASSPLIITSYLGRNIKAVVKLVKLSETLSIPVISSCPSTVNFPHSLSNFVGVTYCIEVSSWLRDADVILVIDCDIPYLPMHNRPNAHAQIFHIDIDVLKDTMGMFHIDAQMRCRADAELAIGQILEALPGVIDPIPLARRAQYIQEQHQKRMTELEAAEALLPEDGTFTVPNILGVLRRILPERTLFMNEAITSYQLVWEHLRPSVPGYTFSSGASSLGWGLGAGVGVSLALRELTHYKADLIVLIVGDGSFLFGIPASAFWMARKYSAPFLTIILNNGGWKAPKDSLQLEYPNGFGSRAPGHQLTVGFDPDLPNYCQIAAASGGAWGVRVLQAAELENAVQKGVEMVIIEKRCAVIDCVLESIEGIVLEGAFVTSPNFTFCSQ